MVTADVETMEFSPEHVPPTSLCLRALLGAVISMTEHASEFPAKFQSRGWIGREIHTVKGKGERGKGRGRYVISSVSAAERRARKVTRISSGWLLLEASQGPKLGREERCCKRDTAHGQRAPVGRQRKSTHCNTQPQHVVSPSSRHLPFPFVPLPRCSICLREHTLSLAMFYPGLGSLSACLGRDPVVGSQCLSHSCTSSSAFPGAAAQYLWGFPTSLELTTSSGRDQ